MGEGKSLRGIVLEFASCVGGNVSEDMFEGNVYFVHTRNGVYRVWRDTDGEVKTAIGQVSFYTEDFIAGKRKRDEGS